MIDPQLSQAEADRLLKIEKHRIDDTQYRFPEHGGSLRIPLKAKNINEDFTLDVWRGKIELRKNTFQTRVKRVVILARIDLGGACHRNPDGEEVSSPHLHLYREGYDDKWAYPLPTDFGSPANIWQTLEDFMTFCNIIEKPNIQRIAPWVYEMTFTN